MKLIIGLGNPGKKYEKTRHNTGFMAVDAIMRNFSAKGGSAAGGQFSIFNFQSKSNSEISEGIIGDGKVILAKPQTFMNESGKAVKAIIEYYKIPAENIIVIHDDLDIPLGEYKIVRDRGSAGHKGVQSIIDALGTKDFTRIRIGIKPLDSLRSLGTKQIPAQEFVLENFTKDEQKIIDEVIEKICGEIEILIKK